MRVLYQSTSLALTAARPSFSHRPRVSCLNARDRVVDFGKYKGRMLGGLPSSYLRWVSHNLRAGDLEHWAGLADQVLRDPVYGDRIEWEFAEAVLKGGGRVTSSFRGEDGGTVAELLQIAERFGWDYGDKDAWSSVDFELLGTSRGGRIPRVRDREERAGNGGGSCREGKEVVVAGIERRRRERRERSMMRMKMKKENGKEKGAAPAIGEGNCDEEPDKDMVYNPFPGRESLLKKVLNTRRSQR